MTRACNRVCNRVTNHPCNRLRTMHVTRCVTLPPTRPGPARPDPTRPVPKTITHPSPNRHLLNARAGDVWDWCKP